MKLRLDNEYQKSIIERMIYKKPTREHHPHFDDINWKAIPGWNDYYVHPKGYVKSIKTDLNPKRYTKITTELILKIFSVQGYSAVNLVEKERRKSCRIHRLVAEIFIPNPNNKPCVNHKNGIKNDNSIVNLEWCTYQENENHSYQSLGKKSPSKPKIMAKERFEIKRLYHKENINMGELAEMFKVHRGTIQRIINKNRKYAGYKNQ